MDEELYAASDALLLRGLPSSVPRELDDEHPIIPLAVDIDQDVAVTAFLCWTLEDEGPIPVLQTVDSYRDQGRWIPTGGAAGTFPEYPIRDRRPALRQGRHLYLCMSGEESSGAGRPTRRDAVLRATAEVDSIAVGARVLRVPFHGYVAVVARTRRTAVVIALDRGGSPLQTLDLSRDTRKLFAEQDRP